MVKCFNFKLANITHEFVSFRVAETNYYCISGLVITTMSRCMF